MKVSQYMSLSVVTVTPQTEFHRAFDLMRSRNIHHLPVVDDGRVVGLVAERDLLLAAANFGSSEVPVGEIMHSPAICIAESALLKEAARLLVERHIGSLPVLDSKKALVGIITETDIFKIAAGMLRARPAARKVAAKTARRAPKKAAKRGKPAVRKTASRKTAARKTAARKTTARRS
ncbi:MAG: CBS domain-containing protein [Burkholderiaceae bacterium]|jgi:CBS domain-containing protein|nr:CBS domain-containing protein [Burkholderiaceae bacterium]